MMPSALFRLYCKLAALTRTQCIAGKRQALGFWVLRHHLSHISQNKSVFSLCLLKPNFTYTVPEKEVFQEDPEFQGFRKHIRPLGYEPEMQPRQLQ